MLRERGQLGWKCAPVVERQPCSGRSTHRADSAGLRSQRHHGSLHQTSEQTDRNPTIGTARCVTPMACERTDNLVGVDILSLVVRVLAFAALTVRFAMCVLGGV